MAFFKGSAYEFTPLFEPASSGRTIFRGLRARRLRNPEAVLEHSVSLRNRLDSVAHEYFSESRDWRWLVEANADVLFPEDLLWSEESNNPDDLDDPSEQIGGAQTGRVVIVPRRKEASG